MKKIIFVTNNQFGYLTDTFKYCEYLGNTYEIEVLCCDNNLPRVLKENIKIHYLKSSNKILKRIEYTKILRGIGVCAKTDIIFIDYFIGCSIVKLLLGNKYIYNVDIRTGAISNKKVKRILINLFMSFETKRFSNISIISRGLQGKLRIKENKAHYLPLGADINIADTNNDSRIALNKNIRMVYVGTLLGRNIEQTVLGIKQFLNKYNNNNEFKIKYDIIGFSANQNDEEIIIKCINDNKLNDVIEFHGRLDNKIALEFIAKANIGISYIPITEYYNLQPPTKTFEYLLSGIPCLATKTFENSQIVNDTNGVLILDTPESFCDGLVKMISGKQCYNSEEIVSSVKDFTWENIIVSNLEPYLASLCDM